EHLHFLRLALLEAEKCIPTPTAFCVGCLLVARWPDDSSSPVILATGHSRELPGNTHAEANALAKVQKLSVDELSALFPSPLSIDLVSVLAYVDVYTTLEPCSVRTSGLAPCVDALIKAKVKRCFIGVGEPDDFVDCEGARKLEDAGIEVVWIEGLEEECLRAARRGH
ncbi:Bifunctional protein RIB2, partial [Termitomyces sp. J132]